MLDYLIKSGACMAILLLFYKLLLERENMHVFKRFFLLGSIIFAFIIPSIVFVEYVEPSMAPLMTTTDNMFAATTQISEQPTDMDVINWPRLLWTVYFVGLVGFGIRFGKHLFQILRRIKINPKLKENFSIKVLLKETLPPHTFFSYIFLNKNKFESNAIPTTVLIHEETHARQYHSLDVLFIEFLQVLFWFNPLVYLFKKSIKLNHEFLADSAVLKKEKGTSNYQNTLLSYLSKESLEKYQSTGIANAINYSSIKKRFTVMKKRTSKKSVLFRSFLLLPLLALLLLGFGERKLVEVQKDSPAVYEVAILIENIEISIDQEGKLFFQESEGITLEELKDRLLNLNKGLSKEEREKQVKAVINVEAETPKKIIEKVDHILIEYGVATINIVGPEPAYKGILIETVTEQSQIEKYNGLAKKYNAIPKEKRKIPLQDLKILESIYKHMSPAQKREALPFPECLPKNQQKQNGASRKQMAIYNTLAKKYNKMDSDHMKILQKDVEQLKYIYSLMSDKQKADAEPFPDLPEPPPVPRAPKSPEESERAAISLEPTPPKPPRVYSGTVDEVRPQKPAKLKEELKSPTTPPPTPPSPLDHIIDMAKKDATFMYQGKQISSDKAIALIKENSELSISTKQTNKGTPIVKISRYL